MPEQEINNITSVRQNLVSAGYLHSTAKSFKKFTANGTGSYFKSNTKDKNEIIKKLLELKELMETRESEFYSIFEITDKNIDVAARRFNKEVLEPTMQNYRILKEMNTIEFYASLGSPYDRTDVAEVVYNNLHKNNKISIEGSKEVAAKILNQISNMLNKKNLYGSAKENKKHKLKKIYNADKKGGLAITEGFYNALEKYKPGITNAINDDLRELSVQYINEVRNKIIRYLKNNGASTKFITSFLKDFDEIFSTFDAIQFSQIINRQGAIGEVINKFTLERIQDRMSEFLKGEGFARLAILYTGTAKTIDKEEEDNGKYAPIDFFADKFGIQSKNTSNLSDFGFNDIHITSKMTLDSFADKLANVEGIDDTMIKQYKYYAQNISWLKNYSYDGVNLKMGDIPEILEFIYDLLSMSSRMLLVHDDNKVKLGNGDIIANHYGSVFYFYRTEFLIPVSFMIDGIIKALDKDSNDTSIGQFSGTGINLKKGNETTDITIGEVKEVLNKKQLYRDKMNSLENELADGQYYYPQNLVDIGAAAGALVRNIVSVSINYKFNLENLVKKVQSIYSYKDNI